MSAVTNRHIPASIFDVITRYTPTVGFRAAVDAMSTQFCSSTSTFFFNPTTKTRLESWANKFMLQDSPSLRLDEQFIAYPSEDAAHNLFIKFLISSLDLNVTETEISNAISFGRTNHPMELDAYIQGVTSTSATTSGLVSSPMRSRPLLVYLYILSFYWCEKRHFQGVQMSKLAELFFVFNVCAEVGARGILQPECVTMASTSPAPVLPPSKYIDIAYDVIMQCYRQDIAIWSDGIDRPDSFAAWYMTISGEVQRNENLRNQLERSQGVGDASKKALMSSLSAEIEADAMLWSSKLWFWVWLAVFIVVMVAYFIGVSSQNIGLIYGVGLSVMFALIVLFLYRLLA